MWVFCWIFHIGFLLDSIFIDFGMGFPKGLGWLWVRFSSGFGLILSWVFWWFGLIFCWFWVNFVVDYERLKWVALVVIGCFSSSSFILLLLDYCVRWDAVFVLWICVSFAGLVNGERERIWMLREKKKTKYCYTQLQEPRIFTRLR